MIIKLKCMVVEVTHSVEKYNQSKLNLYTQLKIQQNCSHITAKSLTH